MTSLFAITLLCILVLGAILYYVATHVARGRNAAKLAALTPALAVLFAVFAVYVAAWMLAILLSHL